MAIQLFGYSFGKPETKVKEAADIPSFIPQTKDDGAIEVAPGGSYGMFVDMEGAARTETDLITKYRDMAQTPEVEYAVDDIVNEAIILDDRALPVQIVLDQLKQPDQIKKKIQAEWDTILDMLDFQNMGYETFKRWYVDGRMYYHMMIDKTKPTEGIKELRYIDPRKIRKIRIPSRKMPQNQANFSIDPRSASIPPYQEYYIYNPQGVGSTAVSQGIRIAPDAICLVTSGLLDTRNKMVLSHLHKASKALNQLRMLEDATVIYRLARAPERRAFYIDVGNLPKQKAEQYLKDMMLKHKNRLVYDATTGEVSDQRKMMTMLEDFWLPRREGGRGTEIITLPGGQNLGEITDVEYFRRKLYKALNVPVSRLEADGSFNIGRPAEISRDELKFTKFINRLRQRFTHLFDTMLSTQLILKGIMNRTEWEQIRNQIHYDFLKDNHFTELKDQEILTSRVALLQAIDPFVGRYYSVKWVRTNILKQSDEDIAEIDEDMTSERGTDPAMQQKELELAAAKAGAAPQEFAPGAEEGPPSTPPNPKTLPENTPGAKKTGGKPSSKKS